MKKTWGAFLFVAFGLSALGCTPSPEKTCQKLQELAEKEAASKSDDKPFKLSMDKCLANMNEMKERDPDAYKCTAKVIKNLSNLDTAFLAISVCDKNKPKKDKDKDSDDDSSSKKKKKKSSDDE